MIDVEYLDLLGSPFERGARGPEKFDCYGLVKEMFARCGKELPDFESPGTLEEIESLIDSESKRWVKVAPGTPGSLVTLRTDTYGAHVGFVMGDGLFIHCVDGIGVIIERLDNEFRPPIGYYDYV